MDIQDTLFERLKLLARKGYKLALFWCDRDDDLADTLKISSQVQSSLTRFTKGLFPNGIP